MKLAVPVGDLLTSQQAGKVLGVGVSSIKRWAAQGLLPVVMTAGGHRRFARADILAFRERHESETRAPDATVAPAGTDPVSRWLETLLTQSDPYVVQGQLYLERAELGAWWKVCERLGQTLHALGVAWAEGRVTVAQEHQASERLSRALGWLASTMPAPDEGRRALLTTVEGDVHTLGLNLVELTLREAGWGAVWGGSLPTVEVEKLLAESRPGMLCMSASLAFRDHDRLERIARRLTRACGRNGVRLVLGGRGPWPETLIGGSRLHQLSELSQLAQRYAPGPR